jgi:hypothetical protein
MLNDGCLPLQEEALRPCERLQAVTLMPLDLPAWSRRRLRSLSMDDGILVQTTHPRVITIPM